MRCGYQDCSNTAKELVVCAQCFELVYCSNECLEQDWFTSHQSTCKGHLFLLSDFFECSAVISKNNFSETKLFKHKKTNEFYAVRIINKAVISVFLTVQSLFQEIYTHKSLSHNNVIKLYDQLEDSSKIYLVLEHVSSVSLREYIKKRKKIITEAQTAKIIIEISLAVKYLHDQNLVHKDLRPEKILISTKGNIKLNDLTSVFYSNQKSLNSSYQAPEVIEGLDHSFQSDVWSIGVIMYELLHGVNPFKSRKDSKKLVKMNEKTYEINTKLSRTAKDLIKKLLEVKPKRRSSVADLLKHRWVIENYPCSWVEAGTRIIHEEFGEGIVSFVKGLICCVDFAERSIEFAIPDLSSKSRLADRKVEDPEVVVRQSCELDKKNELDQLTNVIENSQKRPNRARSLIEELFN